MSPSLRTNADGQCTMAFQGRRTIGVILMLVAMVVNTVVLAAPAILFAGWRIVHEPAVVTFLLLANLFLASEAFSTLCWCNERTRASRPDDVAARRLALATGLAIVSIFWLVLLGRSSLPGFIVVIGVAMFLGGVVLRFVAVQQLRTSFRSDVSIAHDQTLICDGLYRHVRHPSETGLLLIGLGAGVMLGSWAALIVWAITLLPLVIIRIRLEERALHQAFGEAYRRYAQRSASLLLGLY